ncbi:MAG: FABP family protein [Candidatus Cloacimonetes bacterium]|nr:FABP family protein [Candidatus Cloacimonadota bacterium]
MSETINYGPLHNLIGTWTGDKGLDIAPEPEGEERNPYYETITFSECNDVTNAEEQKLIFIQYRQVVRRKSTDKVFHDESGYWMWEPDSDKISHSFSIPRGICVLAEGSYKTDSNESVLFVESGHNDQWPITQSPFMINKAKTTGFQRKFVVDKNKLKYTQIMNLEIYGREFEHKDQNELTLIK